MSGCSIQIGALSLSHTSFKRSRPGGGGFTHEGWMENPVSVAAINVIVLRHWAILLRVEAREIAKILDDWIPLYIKGSPYKQQRGDEIS